MKIEDFVELLDKGSGRDRSHTTVTFDREYSNGDHVYLVEHEVYGRCKTMYSVGMTGAGEVFGFTLCHNIRTGQ